MNTSVPAIVPSSPEHILPPMPNTPDFNARMDELLYHFYLWCGKQSLIKKAEQEKAEGQVS